MSWSRRRMRTATAVLVGLLAGGCASTTVPNTPSKLPVIATASPRAVVTPAPTPTGAPGATARTLPDDSPVDPGTYILGPDALVGLPALSITFTVPGDGWASWSPYGVSKHGGSSVGLGILEVADLLADPCHRGRGRLTPGVGPRVDDLARALAAQPGIKATGPTDATFSGFPARYVELAVDPAVDFAACDDAFFSAGWISPSGDSVPVLGPHQVSRFWVFDSNGLRIVVWAWSFPEASAIDRQELQKAIDSIRIGR